MRQRGVAGLADAVDLRVAVQCYSLPFPLFLGQVVLGSHISTDGRPFRDEVQVGGAIADEESQRQDDPAAGPRGPRCLRWHPHHWRPDIYVGFYEPAVPPESVRACREAARW